MCTSQLNTSHINRAMVYKRAKITLGCLLFRFQCTTNVSRTYIQASELGLALMLMLVYKFNLIIIGSTTLILLFKVVVLTIRAIRQMRACMIKIFCLKEPLDSSTVENVVIMI